MNKRAEARELAARLYALSPAAILDRGYSITRTLPDSRVIRNSRGATVGQMVDVMLAKGSIICKIKRIKNNDRTDL